MTSALALQKQLSVHWNVLEQVEVFKYLGCLLAQDDDDIRQSVHSYRKPELLEVALGRYSGQRTPPLALWQSSIRRWFRL